MTLASEQGASESRSGVPHFGRMNSPTASSFVRGACGDEIEFYLVVSGDVLEEVTFYTEGCGYTLAAGSVTARLAQGKTVREALGVSPGAVAEDIGEIPDESLHCAVMAVTGLYRALNDYLSLP